MSKLKIGDSLYKRTGISGVLAYEVTGIVKRKNAVLYEMLAASCNHGGDACEFLLTEEHGKYKFVSALNDTGEEWDYFNKECPGQEFYLTKRDAIEKSYEYFIAEHEQEIEKYQKKITQKVKDIERLEAALSDIKKKYDDLPMSDEETKSVKIKELVEVVTRYERGKETKYSLNGGDFRTKEELKKEKKDIQPLLDNKETIQ